MKSKLLAFAIAGSLAFVLGLGIARPATTRAADSTVTITLVQQCTSSTTVRATLAWSNYGYTGNQWVDFSYYNNGWLPGTYASVGPIPSNQYSIALDGLSLGTTYYVRINTLVGGVWYPTITYMFVTVSACAVQPVFVPAFMVVPVSPIVIVRQPVNPVYPQPYRPPVYTISIPSMPMPTPYYAGGY